MSTVLDSALTTPVLCCYKNHTQRIQVGKIAPIPGHNLEKVIFPGETFLFEAPLDTKLAIYIELAGKITLFDNIACSRLQTKAYSTAF